jgi:type II secretory pathway component PulC
MRAASLAFAALAHGACGPAVSNLPRTLDDEAESHKAAPATPAPVQEAPSAVAPAGKALRSGTIARDRLIAVLDAGPGMFLRQLEVSPRMVGDRFVGWQLVQLVDRTGPLGDVDVAAGDVLLAINGKPLERPDELQRLWDSLRTANELKAQLARGDGRLELRFTIDPPVASSAGSPAAQVR